MAYRLEITLMGLPKTTNANVGHWRTRYDQAKKWKVRVAHNVMLHGRPPAPLKKAKITLLRYSSGTCDFDGLVSSFKHILDGLILSKVLIDDNMSVIGTPHYEQLKCPRSRGYIKIIVEEVLE